MAHDYRNRNKGPSRERQRPGWLRLKWGVGGVWLHEESGWKVEHCGAALASTPYFADPPGPVSATVRAKLRLGMFLRTGDDGEGETILISSRQRGFRLLVPAQEAVEEVLALIVEELATQGSGEEWP